MKPQRPTRDQLIELGRTNPESLVDLTLSLWDRVEALEAKLAALERNSRNSSKPPSSDKGNFGNPPKPKSLRGKSGRKPGGQQGHPGDTLSRVTEPDTIIEHRLAPDAVCPACGTPLGRESAELPAADCPDFPDCECRQVFDLPAIRIEVTEHRAEKLVCPACGETTTAPFPAGVEAPVQYGDTIRAAALYLGSYQLIPYARLAELFSDLFSCPLSQATLVNIVGRGGVAAATAMEPVREALVDASVAHADESGCRVKGKRAWVHVLSTPQLTSYHIDAKRGWEGMNRPGWLGRFGGKLIHDFLSSYYKLKCRHFLCGAHLLRELLYLYEEMDQAWAGEMIGLLLEAKELRDRENSREAGQRRVIGEKTRARIQLRYSEIVLAGYAVNPEPQPPPGPKRGRVKRSKALNLLIRLEDRYEEIMEFFEYADVPFDNNLAERDLRMIKVREKISGTFRSESGAASFADIRSIISTAKKQSRNVLGTLAKLFRSPLETGNDLAEGSRS